MEGGREEHVLFTRHRPALPTCAVGSTGAAAGHQLDAGLGHGTRCDANLLRKSRSYPLVIQRIVEDLGKG